ncbi:2-C-methyl-D-erythritol 2,4-cyclodiphosphate synthase [bacterium]|nr:2-C-methyl-D-erythritol 2,4-cyclodiphosphate synthase [bacterium]
MIRVGIGYDVHRLVKGRDLIIGGVNIPYAKGLAGHSDADVLIHALMDAILGGLGQGDIGFHFPDTSSEYKGISSLLLLEKINEIMINQGYSIGNVDSVIIAQKPKMKDHIPIMRANICTVFETELSRISVKATTEEGLGFTGDESGIAAWVSVLLQKDKR